MTYRNSSLGFIIDYPPDWKVGNAASIPGEKGVAFTSPNADTAKFFVHIKELAPYLDTGTMTVKNKTLEQVVNEQLSLLSKPNPLIQGLKYKLIRQNQVLVGGNAGWKIEWFMGNETEPFYYVSEVLTVINGKVYSLEYNEKPLKVPETLPLVNKMIESFHIIR